MSVYYLKNRYKNELNEANQKTYDQLDMYIRNSRVDSNRADELLQEIYLHALEAQKKDRLLIDVIGRNPKEYCDELVRELPNNSFKQTMKLFVYIFIVSICILFMNKTMTGSFSISLLDFILFPVLCFGLVLFSRWLIKKRVYKNKRLFFLPVFCLIVLSSLITISIEKLIDLEKFVYQVPPILSLVFTFIISFITWNILIKGNGFLNKVFSYKKV
ncbi:hypothetical protein [Sediminibacillus albus]|uniref:DNA-binding ferritin-like protein (Dps family) n=1 Tax=Sediminibacillus albus TaxID=407036 RepID=A0A1G9BD88_9BACI|nr:hypothetical protein [Sediminibacillus albus]SDK37447.1 hypothetical protein SAMN05216243_2959 [Sediminibacillus albus]